MKSPDKPVLLQINAFANSQKNLMTPPKHSKRQSVPPKSIYIPQNDNYRRQLLLPIPNNQALLEPTSIKAWNGVEADNNLLLHKCIANYFEGYLFFGSVQRV